MQIPSFWNIFFTVSILLLIRVIYKYFVRPYFMLQSLKKLKGAVCYYIPIVGIFPGFYKDAKKYNDAHYSTRLRTHRHPGIRFLASPSFDQLSIELYDPELIKEFCSKMAKSFVKDTRLYNIVPEYLLKGMLFTEGESWKFQRKLTSQVFHFEYMNRCLPSINETCDEWIEYYCKGQTLQLDVPEVFKLYTGAVVWKIFFGASSYKPGCEADEMMTLNLQNLALMTELVMSPKNMIFGKKFLQLGLGSMERKYFKGLRTVEVFFTKVCRDMKQKYLEDKSKGVQLNRPKNLIELFLDEAEKDTSGNKMDDQDLVGQVLTFLIGGTDTTSNLLALSQYLLATHPTVQEKLRQEINECIGSKDITYERISSMKYLDAVVKESLRLYGPAGFILPRVATEDTALGDLKIKKGYSVYIPLLAIAQNQKSFTEPHLFKPERWVEKKDEGVSDAFAFMPFSVGGRRCIGEQLAYIEAKIMLCKLVQKFKLTLPESTQLKMGFGLLYEPKSPLYISYERL